MTPWCHPVILLNPLTARCRLCGFQMAVAQRQPTDASITPIKAVNTPRSPLAAGAVGGMRPSMGSVGDAVVALFREIDVLVLKP
jgi:hypothetical protein